MITTLPLATICKFTTFGDFLRFLRRRAGITQLELSIAVGYSDAQISRLEQNLRLPDVPTIEARFVPALGLENEPEVVSHLIELAANLKREDAPVFGLCPYKGLNYFDEADTDLFIGREKLTAKMVERVLRQVIPPLAESTQFLAIVGSSGTGKSSLVRAGLVPALRWNHNTVNWPIYVLTPTAHPLESLALTLNRENSSVSTVASLVDDLAQDARSLRLFLLRENDSCHSSHCLMVIDQFEEIFSLCRSENQRAAFIDNLLAAVSEDGPAVAVLTLRADFYAHCAEYDLLREVLARQQEYIGVMSSEELRRAIEEPARRGHWEIESGLVELLLHDVGNEPGALPLLSHALFETWHHRRGREMTISGYVASGGVRGSIAETAETVFSDQFTKEQQTIARRLFMRLTELGDETDTIDTRRRTTLDELIIHPEQAEETKSVIKALADARLITVNQDSVEVAHEALIREWPTLRGWLEDNRESLRLHRHLYEAAQEWQRSNKEPDLLYRGVKLLQAKDWAENNLDEMNLLERDFLTASISRQDWEIAERESQRQRELDAAKKLAQAENQRAEEQTANAHQLRKRSTFLVGALVITLLMTATALFLGSQARMATAVAENQQRVSFSRELAAAAVNNLDNDPERSIILALEAINTTYEVDKTWTVEAENSLRQALQSSRMRLTIRGHTDIVTDAAFSPDGKRLATASDDGSVKVWDSKTGQELRSLSTGVTTRVHGIAFSPDGKKLATAGKNQTALIWDVDTGEVILILTGHKDMVVGIEFSPNGLWLATSSEDRSVILWNAETGVKKSTITGHIAEVWGVAFSPDGKRLATASHDTTVKIWDVNTEELLLYITGHDSPVFSVSFNSDGSQLITSGQDRTARVWDSYSGKEIAVLRGHTNLVGTTAFSPDDRLIATGGDDGTVIIWDATTYQELFSLKGHTSIVFSVMFNPACTTNPSTSTKVCENQLVSAGLDRTARVWTVSPDQELLSMSVQNARQAAISPDGSSIATVNPDGSIRIFDISALLSDAFKGISTDPVPGIEAQILCCHSAPINRITFSPDGKSLASTSEDGTAKIWEIANEKVILTLIENPSGLVAVAFSPDGKKLATTGRDYSLRVWDLADQPGKALFNIAVTPGSDDITFSPDGKRLAAGINNGTAIILDAGTGVKILTLREKAGKTWSVAYSPDGTRLATSGDGQVVNIWDSNSGANILSMSIQSGSVEKVVFSPDGKILVTTGQDRTTRFWNPETGEELTTLAGHTDVVIGASFHPQCLGADDPLCGMWLATTGFDDTVRFYLTHIEDLVAIAKNRVSRSMTNAECVQFLHRNSADCPSDTESHWLDPWVSGTFSELNLTGKFGKVCEVTSESGINDQFYNQIAYQGVQRAAELFNWEGLFLESGFLEDYRKNIQRFIVADCQLIIAPVGFFMHQDVETVAKSHPDKLFLAMDTIYDPPIQNVWTEIYAVNEAGFLAGYLAGSVTKTGKVGTFGGANIPPVTDFMNGFVLGVDYYNEKNQTAVEVVGWDVEKQDGLITDDFASLTAGRQMGEDLLKQGVDIILPVAGNVGLGTAEVLRENGNAYLIGVDTDWAVTFPEYADIILTSIQKRLDNTVVRAVQAIIEDNFAGGNHIGTLANGGVSLAPFYNLDSLVTQAVKDDLVQIQADITSGKIKTMP